MLAGRGYDGTSSRIHPVRVSLADDATLRVAWPAGERDYALADVVLNSRLGNTPRVLRLPGGGQVECADDPLLATWFPRPRSRIEALADWLERRRLAILGAALGTAACVFAFFHFGVPWMAAEIATRLPRAVEVAASDQAMVLLRRLGAKPSALPAERRRALQGAFSALVAGQPRHRELRLDFVDAPRFGPNAFALPDGRIFMTDQLVALDLDDDALLAVLAHEAGHHLHRHGMRAAIEGSSVFVVLGLLVGDVSGSSLVATLPSALLTSGFSRGHEREADAYAFDLLERQGRSPDAFARAMEALSRAHGVDDGDPVSGWLSSHPQSKGRIEAARQRAAARPASP